MWCKQCQRPIAAQKTTHRAANTAGTALGLATGGLFLVTTEGWHCPHCGGKAVPRAPWHEPARAPKPSGRSTNPTESRIARLRERGLVTTAEAEQLRSADAPAAASLTQLANRLNARRITAHDFQERKRALLREASDEHACPDCAEQIKKAARVCRFCGYRFQTSDDTA